MYLFIDAHTHIYLYLYLSIYIHTYASCAGQYIYLCIYRCIHTSIYIYIYLSIYLSVSPSCKKIAATSRRTRCAIQYIYLSIYRCIHTHLLAKGLPQPQGARGGLYLSIYRNTRIHTYLYINIYLSQVNPLKAHEVGSAVNLSIYLSIDSPTHTFLQKDCRNLKAHEVGSIYLCIETHAYTHISIYLYLSISGSPDEGAG